jgi:hypothetical protein
VAVRNDECVIYIAATKRKDAAVQTFRKVDGEWRQTSSKGIVRTCTAEQVLSHVLPALVPNSRPVVWVERVDAQ